MAQRAHRAYRSASGVIEIAPGHQDAWWSQVTQSAQHIEHIERLIGWDPYTDLYRIDDGLQTRLYAVTAAE